MNIEVKYNKENNNTFCSEKFIPKFKEAFKNCEIVDTQKGYQELICKSLEDLPFVFMTFSPEQFYMLSPEEHFTTEILPNGGIIYRSFIKFMKTDEFTVGKSIKKKIDYIPISDEF